MLKDNIINLRKLHGFSQEYVASEIGISRQAYSRWELGDSIPDVMRCAALADLFKVSLDALMDRDPVQQPVPKGHPAGLHIFGTVTMSEKGQIVIPKKAREIFQLQPRESLVVLGDEKSGLALMREADFMKEIQTVVDLAHASDELPETK